MGDLTESFDREEFACKCGCGFDTVDYELLKILQELRDELGSPVHVYSGCRCKEHNILVGGAHKSQHLIGRAADIAVEGYMPHEVYKVLNEKLGSGYGLKKYATFVHIDTREDEWRSS